MDDMEDIDLQSSGCPRWSTLEGKKLVSKNEESPPFKAAHRSRVVGLYTSLHMGNGWVGPYKPWTEKCSYAYHHMLGAAWNFEGFHRDGRLERSEI